MVCTKDKQGARERSAREEWPFPDKGVLTNHHMCIHRIYIYIIYMYMYIHICIYIYVYIYVSQYINI